MQLTIQGIKGAPESLDDTVSFESQEGKESINDNFTAHKLTQKAFG
jgi:hypothetical protein